MADKLIAILDGATQKRLRDMGDGTVAEVVAMVATTYALTETSVAMDGTSKTLLAANANRKYLAWEVNGPGIVTVSAVSPVVAGIGMTYNGGGAGSQGGGEEFPHGAPSNTFYAIGPAGTSVTVWEA